MITAITITIIVTINAKTPISIVNKNILEMNTRKKIIMIIFGK
jgi:hypothetical protein